MTEEGLKEWSLSVQVHYFQYVMAIMASKNGNCRKTAARLTPQPKELNGLHGLHKLRAYELADQLALAIYKETCSFPREEMFGLTPSFGGRLFPSPPTSWRARPGKWNTRLALPLARVF